MSWRLSHARQSSCVRQVQQFGHGVWVSWFGDLLASVAAVAEGRVDRLQLFEVELDNGLQLLG
jgi:hypothetical protein